MTTSSQRTTRRRVPRQRNRRPTVTATPQEGGPQRIAKLLARAGVASRREIERMVYRMWVSLFRMVTEIILLPRKLRLDNVVAAVAFRNKPDVVRALCSGRPVIVLSFKNTLHGAVTVGSPSRERFLRSRNQWRGCSVGSTPWQRAAPLVRSPR